MLHILATDVPYVPLYVQDYAVGLAPQYTWPTFNAQYLLDFLRAVSEAAVEFHFRDPQSAGELRPGAADNGYKYRYVVMPMRI